jgi:hypothetical protein
MARESVGNTELVQVWVSPLLKERLKALARERNVTIAEMLRRELPTVIALAESRKVA